MKKKLIALLAGALMTVAFAGNALAYFEDTTLTRVVFNSTVSNEQHIDLGSISTLTGVGYNATLATGAAGWDDLFSPVAGTKVVYFGQDMTTGNFWVSAASGANVTISASQLSNLQSKIDKVQSNDMSKVSTIDGTVAEAMINRTGDTYSYYKQFGTGGKMSSFNVTVETSLTQAATQSLYFFDIAGGSLAGVEVATITTNLNGSTSIHSLSENPAVPIPAAAYLLGSGLLGLVGIRRRMKE